MRANPWPPCIGIPFLFKWLTSTVLLCNFAWFVVLIAFGVWFDKQITIINDSLGRVPSVLVHARDTIYIGDVALTGYKVYLPDRP